MADYCRSNYCGAEASQQQAGRQLQHLAGPNFQLPVGVKREAAGCDHVRARTTGCPAVDVLLT